jgi:hypothetical protein
MLLDNYNIKIEDDITLFAKLINDFKNHGYDAAEIIDEYTTASSLRDEVIVNNLMLKLSKLRILPYTKRIYIWKPKKTRTG